jgi:hypothetical protein
MSGLREIGVVWGLDKNLGESRFSRVELRSMDSRGRLSLHVLFSVQLKIPTLSQKRREKGGAPACGIHFYLNCLVEFQGRIRI